MQKVKEFISALQQPADEETSERLKAERQKDIDENLKPEIDLLLHRYLPDHITIQQAEVLAMTIFHMIEHPEEFLNA